MSCESLIVSLQEIEDREEENPDQINEVPEQTGNLNAIGVPFRVGFPQAGQRTPNRKNHNSATQNVERVQPGQRKINRQVGAVPRTVILHLLDLGHWNGDV